jgi:hypothetical protein
VEVLEQAWREVYPLGNESSGFLQDGGLSIGAMSPLGLSLPEVLANEATGGGRKQINVIFMFLQGGFW